METGAGLRFDPVTDWEDDIEIVELDWFIGAGNVQILYIALLIQFTLPKGVAEMFGDHRTLAAEVRLSFLLWYIIRKTSGFAGEC